tara:strand:- start:3566 stop:3928 length:363 start_codon:yes stop_codon:yes gene_type:complete
MSKAITGNNLFDFVTGMGGNSPGQFKPGADDGRLFSLPELVGFRLVNNKVVWDPSRPHWGTNTTLTSAVKHNLATNGMQALGTAVLVPVGVRVFRRLSSRAGVTKYVNKAFKMTGLPVRM